MSAAIDTDDVPADAGVANMLARLFEDRNKATSPALAAIQREQLSMVLADVADLKPRDRQALVLRFGLDDGQGRTYRQIGETLGFSATRAHDLVARSLRTLRASRRSKRVHLIAALCGDEAEQKAMFKRFKGEGLKVRVATL